MKEIKVQFEYWMNNHSDSWLVRSMWVNLQEKIERSIPKTMQSVFEEKLWAYLQSLEYQAYSAGFAAGIRLSAECFEEMQETDRE